MSKEWQVAEGSRTAHVIDTDRPAGKRSGPRALCGRYPQRNWRDWFSLGVDDPGVLNALRGYGCATCPDCSDALTA